MCNLKTGFAQTAECKKIMDIIDSTLLAMKENAVNTKIVNWTEIRANALKSAVNLQSPYELGPTIRGIYKSLNDFHGAFSYGDSTFQWHRSRSLVSDSVMNELKKGVSVKTELLDHQIGYLRIPGMSIVNLDDYNTKAQKLNDSLCTLLSKNVKSIIVDLRLNRGGAMHPMILGVENLLSSGKFGSFVGKTNDDWIIKDHQFLVGNKAISTITPKCNLNAQNLPIVILVGPQTASSGEFLIMAFKGRKNTILLGETTAGFVTVNAGFQVTPETFINLSVGYGADRNGHVYTEAITPDILFTSVDQFNNIKSDAKVKAAVDWLKKQ
jgi:C-terminal processing protease CtpA/Prc